MPSRCGANHYAGRRRQSLIATRDRWAAKDLRYAIRTACDVKPGEAQRLFTKEGVRRVLRSTDEGGAPARSGRAGHRLYRAHAATRRHRPDSEVVLERGDVAGGPISMAS